MYISSEKQISEGGASVVENDVIARRISLVNGDDNFSANDAAEPSSFVTNANETMNVTGTNDEFTFTLSEVCAVSDLGFI